jgi:hypothetical protein
MPEYLALEERHGVELFDWSRLGASGGHRSVARSMRHVMAALGPARGVDVLFADGEHIGIPMALLSRALRIDTPQLTIAHNLLRPAKQRILRHLRVRPVDRFLTHSTNQVRSIVATTRLSEDQLAVVPYAVDTSYWSGTDDGADAGLVVSAGREHRDYRTLVSALPSGATLTIADHSIFTPQATRCDPAVWPPSVQRVALDAAGLRELYRQADVVVVPVIDSSMPAGITTLLEAMSMGKAVVVTESSELRGVVEHGASGLVVETGDVAGMHRAIESLLSSPSTRRALGRRAREVAVERYDVNLYADRLADHLNDLRALGGRRRGGLA